MSGNKMSRIELSSHRHELYHQDGEPSVGPSLDFWALNQSHIYQIFRLCLDKPLRKVLQNISVEFPELEMLKLKNMGLTFAEHDLYYPPIVCKYCLKKPKHSFSITETYVVTCRYSTLGSIKSSKSQKLRALEKSHKQKYRRILVRLQRFLCAENQTNIQKF